MLDWFIWNNAIHAIMFTAILFIYINYIINNFNNISSFINLSKKAKEENKESFEPKLITPTDLQTSSNCNLPNTMNDQLVSLPYDTNRKSRIMAFDKQDSSVNEIYEVYKSDKPYLTIVDSEYAKIMLNDLYQTPQYKNIENIEINKHLEDDKYSSDKPENPNRDKAILDSFRHPTRNFIDSKWLSSNGTYNDNQICNVNSNNLNKIVKFGKKLELCTNQDNSVSKEQLEYISTNEIPSMEI